jgi:carbonic anhydrase/acetyltransferase-like protein (isoleucine patch superfamily)
VPVYALGDLQPDIHPDAFVHPDAVLIGAVVLGAFASVWPGAVIRADNGRIAVGARTSVQDGSVIHTTYDDQTVIGSNCVIGHMVHLEGCVLEDECLVGNGAIVLARARVCTGAVVGAQAVVTGGTVVPPDALALGVPAKIREGAGGGREHIVLNAQSYVDKVAWYKNGLRRLD